MDLTTYLAAFRRRWLVIVVVCGACVAGAVGLALLTTPVYSATAQLYVSVQAAGSTDAMLQGSTFARQQVQSYVLLADTSSVLDPAIKQLGLGTTAQQLAAEVTAGSPDSTSIINLTVNDSNAAQSAAIANAVATSLGAAIEQLETPIAGGTSSVKVSVTQPARVPSTPQSPKLVYNVAVGFLVGLAAGAGLALLREYLDSRIHGDDDIRLLTSRALLASIGDDPESPRNPLSIAGSPQSARSEAYRRLRTSVQFLAAADEAARVFVVTSAVPGEGKTTTSANLAMAFAENNNTVLLIDADLRKPGIAAVFGIESAVGLSTVLAGRVSVEDALVTWGSDRLHLLPAGQVPPNPSELLGSARMHRLLQGLRQRYDIVIIDSSPMVPVTDAAITAGLAGATLLVVGVGIAHRQEVEDALTQLEAIDTSILGIVVNREAERHSGYRSSGYGYTNSAVAAAGPRRAR